MIVKPALAALLASGLIVPEKPALVFPKPAIVKSENLEFTKHLLLGMPMTMGMLKGGSPSVVLLSGGGFGSSGGSATTYTFPSIAFGSPSPTRTIFAYVGGSNGSASGRTIASVSIGGVSATILRQQTYDSSGGCSNGALAVAQVPSGTSGDVVVTFSANMARAGGWAMAFDNVKSLTAHATLSAPNANPMTGTLNWLAGGVVVAGSTVNDGTSFTWTGVTEQHDFIFNGGNTSMSGGYLLPTANATGGTVRAAAGLTQGRYVLIAASFR